MITALVGQKVVEKERSLEEFYYAKMLEDLASFNKKCQSLSCKAIWTHQVV